MENAPTIDAVLQAIFTLYRQSDVNDKEKASAWLQQLQTSVYAWTIADELLLRRGDIESTYFGAQTMRTKIQHSFHELPVGSHASLRDSLIQHVGSFGHDVNPIVLTQLSLAIADLALQMPTWENSTADLIQKFGENPTHIPALLEILIVLPEEVRSRQLRIGANRREQIVEEFKQVGNTVLQLLCACSSDSANFSSTPNFQVRIFKCLSSWLDIRGIDSRRVVQSTLIVSLFKSLTEPNTPSTVHEAAADCVCTAILLIEDLKNHEDLGKVLCQGVVALCDCYHMSVANEDTDRSCSYCRIFTELAESLLVALVDYPGKPPFADMRIVDLLLMCVGHHDYEIAEITFNFWYRLSNELYKRNDDNLTLTFRPFIERLIAALCRHCQLDSDHEVILEEGEDFFDFRSRVTELLGDIIFIVGSSRCFKQMFENLKAEVNANSWETVEASLFVMSCVAKTIIQDENEVVPLVLDAILTMAPNTHLNVRHTSIQLVGHLNEWIEVHPNYLEPVLNMLVMGLQVPKLANASATALESICTTCQDKMAETHFSGLLHIMESLANNSMIVKSNGAVSLVKGTAMVLTKMPKEKIEVGMTQMVMLQAMPLAEYIRTVSSSGDCTTLFEPQQSLDRLAALFRHTKPIVTTGEVHPCQAAFVQVWPVLSDICKRFVNDSKVMEKCCRCIRFAVRCVGKQSAPLLGPMVELIVTLYQTHPHSCFLYLGSILVDEYGNDPTCSNGLLEMLRVFCPVTFTVLNEENGLRNHPDTVDDFFRLCTRYLQRCPLVFLQCDCTKQILECCTSALLLDHRDANSSVTKFINEFVKVGRTFDENADFETRARLVDSFLGEYGMTIITNAVKSSVFIMAHYLLSDTAEFIYQMMLFNRQNVCIWLESTLKAFPVHSTNGLVIATNKQLVDFHRTLTMAENEKQVKRALQDFAQLFR